jgi:putative aminopeptidase FrvX
MLDTSDSALQTLARLCAFPAVSYHERPVAHAIRRELEDAGLDVQADEFGNLIASAGSGETPGIAFVAHMDHPGFEPFTSNEHEGPIYVRALGGVPVASLKHETPVLIVAPEGKRSTGTLHPVSDEEARAVGAGKARVARLETSATPSPGSFVVFDLPDFELDGDVIRARALDDLAGCAAIVSALKRLALTAPERPVYGVFTRAEEDGLIGARAMAGAGTLPSDTIVVSVEASSVIPGVAQGDGPVVRTGDRTYSFDAGAEQVLVSAARELEKQDEAFKWQRALMSGGTCEATAFAVHGYATTGIAFPLGNYHNATTSIPDPEGGVGAEYIALADYLAGVDLIERAGRVSGSSDGPLAERLRQVPPDEEERLRQSASG